MGTHAVPGSGCVPVCGVPGTHVGPRRPSVGLTSLSAGGVVPTTPQEKRSADCLVVLNCVFLGPALAHAIYFPCSSSGLWLFCLTKWIAFSTLRRSLRTGRAQFSMEFHDAQGPVGWRAQLYFFLWPGADAMPRWRQALFRVSWENKRTLWPWGRPKL